MGQQAASAAVPGTSAGGAAAGAATSRPTTRANVPETVQTLCEELQRLVDKRSPACGPPAVKLWSFVLESNKRREELVKSGGVQLLSAALECGDADARYAAMGSLAALLAADDRWLSEVASGPPAPLARMLSAAAAMAAGHHDRSRLEAAGLLACAARVPELAARVWGSAAPALAAALLREPPPGGVAAATAGTPGWAGQRRLQRAAGLALKALLEPSEWEPDAVRAVRRREVLRMVGLGPLLALAAGLAGSSGRRSSGGGSDNGDCDSGSGRGAPHAELQLAAAAILRFVVLVPEAAQEVAGDPSLAPSLVAALSTPLPLHGTLSDAGRALLMGRLAFLTGTAWELASFPGAAAMLCDAGAVEALLAVVAQLAPLATSKGAKGAGKKGKKPEGAGAEPPKGQAPPAPAASRALPSKAQDEAAAGAAALSNSVGALQHLSMLDEGKERLVAAPGGAAQLAQLLRAAGASAPAAWDAALGALWNMSLLAGADQALAEAGAPAFLCTAPRAMRLPSQPGGA